MAKSELIEQLHTLNEVLSRTGLSDPDCARDARRALEFYEQEVDQMAQPFPMEAAAEHLLRLHLDHRNAHQIAFAHWHVPTEGAYDLLWLRLQIIEKMKSLAGKTEALFLVTGMRESICSPSGYWTRKRATAYQDLLNWVNEMICAWASRGSRLQVVVI